MTFYNRSLIGSMALSETDSAKSRSEKTEFGRTDQRLPHSARDSPA
jgi:hypothetical protein